MHFFFPVPGRGHSCPSPSLKIFRTNDNIHFWGSKETLTYYHMTRIVLQDHRPRSGGGGRGNGGGDMSPLDIGGIPPQFLKGEHFIVLFISLSDRFCTCKSAYQIKYVMEGNYSILFTYLYRRGSVIGGGAWSKK